MSNHDFVQAFAAFMILFVLSAYWKLMFGSRRGSRFEEIIDDDGLKPFRRFQIPTADQWIAAHHPKLPKIGEQHPCKREWKVQTVTVRVVENAFCEAVVEYAPPIITFSTEFGRIVHLVHSADPKANASGPTGSDYPARPAELRT